MMAVVVGRGGVGWVGWGGSPSPSRRFDPAPYARTATDGQQAPPVPARNSSPASSSPRRSLNWAVTRCGAAVLPASNVLIAARATAGVGKPRICSHTPSGDCLEAGPRAAEAQIRSTRDLVGRRLLRQRAHAARRPLGMPHPRKRGPATNEEEGAAASAAHADHRVGAKGRARAEQAT